MTNQIIYVGTDQSSAELYKMVQRLERSRPFHFDMHRPLPNVQLVIPILRALPEYQAARKVLITDDGIASALYNAFEADLKDCYYIEPRDGYVVSTLPLMLPRLELAAYRTRSFSRLPRFDLFVTGCYGVYSNAAYTGADKLVMAFKQLKQAGRVTNLTCRVVLEELCEDGPNGPSQRLSGANIVITHGYTMHRNKPATLKRGK